MRISVYLYAYCSVKMHVYTYMTKEKEEEEEKVDLYAVPCFDSNAWLQRKENHEKLRKLQLLFKFHFISHTSMYNVFSDFWRFLRDINTIEKVENHLIELQSFCWYLRERCDINPMNSIPKILSTMLRQCLNHLWNFRRAYWNQEKEDIRYDPPPLSLELIKKIFIGYLRILPFSISPDDLISKFSYMTLSDVCYFDADITRFLQMWIIPSLANYYHWSRIQSERQGHNVARIIYAMNDDTLLRETHFDDYIEAYKFILKHFENDKNEYMPLVSYGDYPIVDKVIDEFITSRAIYNVEINSSINNLNQCVPTYQSPVPFESIIILYRATQLEALISSNIVKPLLIPADVLYTIGKFL